MGTLLDLIRGAAIPEGRFLSTQEEVPRETPTEVYLEEVGEEPVTYTQRISDQTRMEKVKDYVFNTESEELQTRHKLEALLNPSPEARKLRHLVVKGEAELPFKGDPIAQIAFDPSIFSVYDAPYAGYSGMLLKEDRPERITKETSLLAKAKKRYEEEGSEEAYEEVWGRSLLLDKLKRGEEGALVKDPKRRGTFNIELVRDKLVRNEESEGRYSTVPHELRHRGIEIIRQMFPNAKLGKNKLFGKGGLIDRDLYRRNSEEVYNRYLDLMLATPEVTEEEKEADIQYILDNTLDWNTTDEDKKREAIQKDLKKVTGRERELKRKLESLAEELLNTIYK